MIAARTTGQDVRAKATGEEIVTAAAVDAIGSGGADDGVIAISHQGILKITELLTNQRRKIGDAGGHAVVIVTVKSPVVDGVSADTTIHILIAKARLHQIIAGFTVVTTAIAIGGDDVVAEAAVDGVDASTAGEGVITIAAEDAVVASAAIDRVVASAAIDDVVTSIAEDLISEIGGAIGQRSKRADHIAQGTAIDDCHGFCLQSGKNGDRWISCLQQNPGAKPIA